MLNLSIMPLNTDNLEQISKDVIEQQRTGVSTHAMFMMYFSPEGTPPIDRAEIYCKKYEAFKDRLKDENVKTGVLVQSTLGHITVPPIMHPFQNMVDVSNGDERKASVCPYDKGFQKYIKGQMKRLAQSGPEIILIDDDVGLLYKVKGCACPLHMAEFNKRAGTNLTREELYTHLKGNSELDKKYQEIFVEIQKDSLLEVVSAMREGIDEVDPTIQGAISGISGGFHTEFPFELANAFAGKGNKPIARLNGGIYCSNVRGYTPRMYRSAALRECFGDREGYFLAETDTCPHNRYSTSASFLHMHFTASIMEGANGAKHWLTRSSGSEPKAGVAYRKILSKYSGFYKSLCEYVKVFKPFGARIPIYSIPHYPFRDKPDGIENVVAWSTSVLERIGLPLYFSSKVGGAVFLDEYSVLQFKDEDIKVFLKGTLVLSSGAAENLIKRGFGKYLGVEICKWEGKKPVSEFYQNRSMPLQIKLKQIKVVEKDVKIYSTVKTRVGDTYEDLFPGVTGYKNSLGGLSIVFSGTPDAKWSYFTSFSMLNETRKQQLIDIMKEQDNIDVYYPDDAEVYLKAGYLPNGEMMVAFFNIGLDVLEDITLISKKKINKIERLSPSGERVACDYVYIDGVIHVKQQAGVLLPEVLFLS
ncbi:MAG: hypothetical protein IKB98_05680 [Clostridia bacterium]|nr:hypothetical protein [Clostridia bacterium]